MQTQTFSATVPKHSKNRGFWRYSFNGQEKDDEIAGISGANTTALFWEYDSRLGRRWNLDPKPTVGISDYACFANNPAWHKDPLGDTTKYYNQKGELLYDTKDGSTEIIIIHQSKISDFTNKINKINQNGEINNLEKNKKELYVLGKKIFEYKNDYKIGNDNYDAGFPVGYDLEYNNKSTWKLDLFYIFLSLGREGAEIRTGYLAGKKAGAIDVAKGYINKMKPLEGLKSNKPLVKIKENKQKK